jgi:hypothetical protein
MVAGSAVTTNLRKVRTVSLGMSCQRRCQGVTGAEIGGGLMIVQRDDETRIQYLARVLHWVAHNTCAGSETAEYDETTCDLLCLADDFVAETGAEVD